MIKYFYTFTPLKILNAYYFNLYSITTMSIYVYGFSKYLSFVFNTADK